MLSLASISGWAFILLLIISIYNSQNFYFDFIFFHFYFYSCSQSESKGSDCYEAFKTMQECMVQYPTVYDRAENDRSSDDTLMSSEGEDPSIEEPSNSNKQENTATTKA